MAIDEYRNEKARIRLAQKEVERIQELEQTADEVAIKARVAALRSQRVN